MTIEEQLKDLIKIKYKSIRAFTQKLSMPYSTVDNMLKRGIGGTGISILIPVCNELNIDIDALSKGEINPKNEKIQLYITSGESEVIKKYRTLDEYGKRMIDLVLNEEYTRCSTEPEEETPTINIRHSTYKVSAGRGFDLEDRDSWEEIEIPDTPIARKADFAITIIGDSMEPIYSDGQIVLVREQSAVDIGETGVYIVNGGGFIKINGGDRLISINPEYDDISFNESDSVYCAGKVIGVV